MRATSGFVQLFIRGIAWDAADAGDSFADALKAAARARLTDTSRGKVLTGTGSGGTTVTYMLPPLGALSAGDIADVCAAVLARVDQLIAADPSLDGNDEGLVAALLANPLAIRNAVPAVRTVRPDFSIGLLRL